MKTRSLSTLFDSNVVSRCDIGTAVLLAIFGLLFLSAEPTRAQTAFTGTFDLAGGGNDVSSIAYNGIAIPTVTVGALTKNGITSSSSSGNFRGSNWPTVDALDGAKFIEFTLTPTAGTKINLASLTFGVGRSATGTTRSEWRSSVDGYSSTISTYSAVNGGLTNSGGVLTNPDSNSSWTGNVLDLSGAPYQNLTAEIRFRLYFYNAEATGGTAGLQGNLSFAGVSVPDVPPGNVDGLGTAVATNGGAAPLVGTTVFRRNQAAQTLSLALTGVSTAPLTTVQVDVPAGWSGLSIGNVSLSGTGFSGAAASLADVDTIQITGAALTNTATGIVTVSSLTTPNPTALTDTGAFSFPVRTAGASGTLTAIANPPSVRVTIPIINLSDVDTNDGVALDLGTTVAIEGVATPVSSFTSGGLNSYLQDEGDGVGLFRTGGADVIQGDRYVAVGVVGQSRGLTRLEPSSDANVIRLGTDVVPSPLVRTLAQLLSAPETLEGQLVRVNGVALVPGGTWPASGANSSGLVITDDGGTTTLDLFVDLDTDIDGSVAPTGTFDLVGIFSQFGTTSAPFDSGYQILPRTQADIIGGTSGPVTVTLAGIASQPALPVAPGTSNAVLAGFTLAADGAQDVTGVTVTLAGTATGSDLSAVRIFWDQDGNGAINGDAAITGPLAFGGSVAFTGITGQTFSGTRTFLIVANVEAGATVGSTVTASVGGGNFTTTGATKVGSATGAERTIQTSPVVGVGSLFFSEYIEGSSFNKALEIYNNSGQAVDLSDFRIEAYFNGNPTVSQSLSLSGTLASGGVFVAAHASAAQEILNVANATSSSVINHNGDDAFILRRISDNAVFDMFGVVGTDPGAAWVDGTHSTLDQTLRRQSTVTAGNPVGLNPITNLSAEWDSFPFDTFDGLGTHFGPGSATNATLAGVTPQPSVTIAPGTSDAVLARFRLTHSGLVDFTAVTLGFAGTATSADLENVRVFRDENGNALIDGADAAIAGPAAFSASVPFASLTTGQSFSGLRNYLIVANVTAGATSGRTVTASIASGAFTTTAATTTGSATGNQRTIQVPVPATLVINEIDYDQDGTDEAEFVELFNSAASAVDLTGYTLVFVNATGSEYRTTNLSGSITAGGYLVVGNIPGAAIVGNPSANWIQNGNGSAVVLRDASSAVVDALAYGGNGSGFAEGTATSAVDSGAVASVGLSRIPNGTDTNNNDADFQLVAITPGAANASGPSAPVLAAPTSTGVTGTAATLGGNVTADGGAAVTARGVVYAVTATNGNPEIGGTGVIQAAGTGTTGVFTVNVTGLTPGTAYSFKAYATNSVGTGYTAVGTFVTPSTNADLSALALSAGTLAPVFSAGTTTYTASVSAATTSLTVTPTASQGNAVIEVRVNGGSYASVGSGNPSAGLALNAGANPVNVRVTAQDAVTQKLYTITVTRQGAPTVANPTSTAVAGITATLGGNVTSDNGSTVSSRGVVYAPTTTNNNPEIGGIGVVQATGTGTTGVFTVGVTGLTPGLAYSFKAYATNGEGSGYSTVGAFTTLSSVSTLSNLVLGGGSLSPSFAPGILPYTSSVPFSTTSVTVTPTASHAGSTIRVNGTVVASGGTSAAIPLNVGSGNVITVQVTAPDGVSISNYTVTVTRRADSRLSGLVLSQGTLTPTFVSGTLAYTATVPFEAATVTLTPTVLDAAATVTVAGDSVASGTASAPVNLAVGANSIPVVVTATDSTTTIYTVTVTRRADPSLASLTLSAGTLDPVFAPATTTYSAGVLGTTTAVTVTPVTSDPSATVTVNGGSPSTPVTLTLGVNVVTVLVTAADGIATRTYTINLTRQAPEIAVRRGATDLISGEEFLVASASPGSTATTILTLFNLGQEPLVLGSVTLSGDHPGDFEFDLAGVTEVAPGGQVPLEVTFSPSATTIRTATLEIESNDNDESTFAILLEGSGDHRAGKPLAEPADETPDPQYELLGWEASATGSYEGVLRSRSDATQVVGAVLNLVVSAPPGAGGGGLISGAVRVDGYRAAFSGQLGINGLLERNLPQPDGSVLSMILQLGRTAGTGKGIVRILLAWQGVSAEGHLAKKRYSTAQPVPVPLRGRYTVLFPSGPGWGVSQPGGDGWATAQLNAAGTLTLSGRLGDGFSFTETATLSGDQEATFFVDLYRIASRRGWIGGKLVFRSVADVSDFDGRLRWVKLADPAAPLYPVGFDERISVIGSRFVPQPTGRQALAALHVLPNRYNAEMSLIGPTAPGSGAAAGALDRVLTWNRSDRLLHFGPEQLSGSVLSTNGALSGSFRETPTGGLVSFTGVAFQKQQRAAGVFINGAKSGALRILPGERFPYPGSTYAGELAKAIVPQPAAGPPTESAVSPQDAVNAGGTYTGLLTEGGRVRGAITGVQVTSTGAVSGAVWINGVRRAFSGSLGTPIPTTGGITLTLTLYQIDGVADSFGLTGVIQAGGATYQVDGQRRPLFSSSSPAPQAGRYTVVISAPADADGSLVPAGDGYGALQVDNGGNCLGTLVLADGHRTTFAGHLGQEYDDSGDAVTEWSFHRGIYEGPTPRGFVSGKIHFRDKTAPSALDGTVRWVKKAGALPASPYPTIDVDRQVVGGVYQAPSVGTRAMVLSESAFNVWLRFAGQDLSRQSGVPLTQFDRAGTWTTGNRIRYYGPEAVESTFNVTTGLVEGRFVDGSLGIDLRFGGALLQGQNRISGHNRSAGVSGFFGVQPR